MKILQINAVNKIGSTGRTCIELHDFLAKKGFESYIAYGYGEIPEKNKEYRITNFLGYYSHNIFSKIFNNQGSYSYFATKKFIKWIDEIKPDVIHLRNLYGNFLNFKLFFKYLRKKGLKVVLTTHDFWWVTGNCFFPMCSKYSEGCKNCIMFKRNRNALLFKRSRYNFLRKFKYLSSLSNLTIQCNSYYSQSIINKSFLKDFRKVVIYNWIDNTKFYPDYYPNIFGIETKKPIILSIWAGLNENSYRFKKVIEISKKLHKTYCFIIIGKNNIDRKKYPTVNILDGTNDVSLLRKYYSTADLFFNPSITDSFCKVVAESFCCGTPAVVLKSQSLPELVGNDCGAICENDSDEEIIKKINEVIHKGKKYYKEKCIQKAQTLFSKDYNCEQLVKMYEEQ